MFDFKLTKSGDIEEDLALPLSEFHLRFNLTNHAVQRFHFFTSIPSQNISGAHQQRLSFKFVPVEDYLYKQKNVEDTDEIVQAIRLALKTEIGDTYDYEIGSNLYQTKHTMYKSAEDLESIQMIIQSVAQNFLPNCNVDVSFETSDGWFYCQNVTAVITDNNKFITKFVV